MTVCASCGGEAVSSLADRSLCPACLLRLGLDTADSAYHDSLAQFRLIAPVGRGPHATVYLAEVPMGQPRFITVKLFHQPLDAPRFIAHVRELAARLQTSAVASSLTILDASSVNGSMVFVIARYVPGTSIDAYCRSSAGRHSGRMSLVARLCRLVSDMHHSNIVHGSIKASNVIVTPGKHGPVPVLLDAGLGLAMESARSTARTTWNSPPPAPSMPDRRDDLVALRRLVVDLLNRDDLADARGSIQALMTRSYESASELAADAAALADRTVP